MSRLLAVLVLLWSASAHASRFAIVIGSNEGQTGEPELRFAERDARRVGEMLVRLGDVHAEDVLLLLTPDASELERAIKSMRARIVPGEHTTLFVYYSGHADERALHLSGSTFAFAKLKAQVKELGAELAVFVLDACRSGGIVRAKGVKRVSPFAFEVKDERVAEGLAIITSSAENEDAQESDRLEGGVFTHHLLTGLAGAADRSGDDQVSLAEAYRYAYTQTIAATSTTETVQHPTYAFELKGQDDIVVTRLDHEAGRGRLRLEAGGEYLVFDRRAGQELVAELDAAAGTDLWLRPGRYLVRLRDESAAYEHVADVADNQITAVSPDALVRVPYRHAVRKGYDLESRRALSLGAGFDASSPVLDGTGPLFGASIGFQIDLAALAVEGRVRYLHGTKSRDDLTVVQDLVGGDVAIFHLFDAGRHGFGFGVRAGADWYMQDYSSTERLGTSAAQLVPRVAALARAEVALGSSLTMTLDAGAEVFILNQLSDTQEGTLTSQSALTVSLSLSGVLPW